jgi:hypothetical protein
MHEVTAVAESYTSVLCRTGLFLAAIGLCWFTIGKPRYDVQSDA